MPALWRCINYLKISVLHNIDPNSKYISANEPKPNPGYTYGAVQYSERNFFILIK